jgi:putative transposase
MISIHEIRTNSTITHAGQSFRVSSILDLETLLAVPVDGGEARVLHLDAIHMLEHSEAVSVPLAFESIEKQADLTRKLQAISVLQKDPPPGLSRHEQVQQRAEEYEVHRSTIYEWSNQYSLHGAAGITRSTRRDAGRHKLNQAVELIIADSIKTLYLDRQRRSMKTVFDAVEKRCTNAAFPVPSFGAVRSRILEVSLSTRAKKRHGEDHASHKHGASRRSALVGQRAHDLVQMDHHLLDIELVDEESREPCGRAWLTTALDTTSRAALGIHVTYDSPSSVSVAMCLVNAISPKTKWLSDRNIPGSWPCAGLFKELQVDNAKEFRSPRFELSCAQYGINVSFRRPHTPHDGPHIERYHRTLEAAIHELPGTTFSSPTDKGDYQSATRACFTRREFEAWLGDFIVNTYHQKDHRGIGLSPLVAYERSLLGDGKEAMPARVNDLERLYLDFLPAKPRSVTSQGIELNRIRYYTVELDDLINNGTKYMVCFDPGNLDRVYLFEPKRKGYITVPYNNLANPPISRSQLEASKRLLKLDGIETTEKDLFAAHERLQQRTQAALKTTRRVRRTNEMSKDALKPPVNPVPASKAEVKLEATAPGLEDAPLNFAAVAPFALRTFRRTP